MKVYKMEAMMKFITDYDILKGTKNHDETAWENFYNFYAPLIRLHGRDCGLKNENLEDLVQNVMLKFFNAEKKFVWREEKAKFRTWFAAVIRSQAVELIRANSRARREPPEFADESDPFAEEFMREWRKALLDEALDALRLRVDAVTFQAFELYGLQDRDVEKVAEVLEMSQSQIYAAKNRCVKILRRIVERHNRNDGDLHLEI